MKKYIFVLAVLVFAVVAFFILSSRKTPTNPSPQRDTVQAPEPPPPSPNPTYVEKVRREPFWEKLPYFSQNYKIEYRDSADTVFVTTFLPASKTEFYKQEAIQWLRRNGAKVDTLKIEYVRGVKDY